jgi:phage shock protein E
MKAIACLILISAVASLPAQEKPVRPEASASLALTKAYKNLDPEAFDKMRRTDTNAVVLDVRTKAEYEKGHIPGSVRIDFNSPDFEKELRKLEKTKTYLVYCAAGIRSARACKKMDSLNLLQVYNLAGGLGAWEKAGKPVQK